MSIEGLIETINTQKPLKAAQAVRELGRLSDERAIDILIHVLYHGNVLTQQAAAEALASFNTDIVTQALCAALKEVSPLIRIQIIKSLEQMKCIEAIPCLIEALQNAESESLQYTIIETLGNLRALQALDMIEPYLNTRITMFVNAPASHSRRSPRQPNRKYVPGSLSSTLQQDMPYRYPSSES